jgi:hypothetical protein
MDKSQAVTSQPLKNEALPTEKPCSELTGESYFDIYSSGSTKKSVFLT